MRVSIRRLVRINDSVIPNPSFKMSRSIEEIKTSVSQSLWAAAIPNTRLDPSWEQLRIEVPLTSPELSILKNDKFPEGKIWVLIGILTTRIILYISLLYLISHLSPHRMYLHCISFFLSCLDFISSYLYLLYQTLYLYQINYLLISLLISPYLTYPFLSHPILHIPFYLTLSYIPLLISPPSSYISLPYFKLSYIFFPELCSLN